MAGRLSDEYDEYEDDYKNDGYGADENDLMYDPDAGTMSDYNGDIKEDILERLIEEYFGGIPKEEIIEILRQHYPENFD